MGIMKQAKPNAVPAEAAGSCDVSEPLPRDITRRQLLAAMGAGLFILGGGAVVANLPDIIRLKRELPLRALRDEFNEITHSLPSSEVFNRGAIVDLAAERYRLGIEGGLLVVDAAAVGTSNSYVFGTMDDRGGLFNQPHAALQIAADSLSDTARSTLGIGEFRTAVAAIPGAYSGYKFPDDPNPRMYGILSQLQDPKLQAFMGEGRGLKILSYEGGLDDYRLLASNAVQLERNLTSIIRTTTDRDVTQTEVRQLKQQLEYLHYSMLSIGHQFKQNLIAAGGMVAAMDSQTIFCPAYTPDLYGMDRLPISLIQGNNNDAALKEYLQPDLTDPDVPDRYYLNVAAIPYGHDIARLAGMILRANMTEGLRAIHRGYPELRIVPQELMGVNQKPGYYAVRLPDGKVDPDGDGHPGPLGIQYLAANYLSLLHNRANGKDIPAAALARFPPAPGVA